MDELILQGRQMGKTKAQRESIPVNEETFHNAVNNASVFARKRLFKKMEKVVFPRHGKWVPTEKVKLVMSPLTGLPIVTQRGMIDRQGRPPKDLEEYVTNFVRTHYKEAK